MALGQLRKDVQLRLRGFNRKKRKGRKKFVTEIEINMLCDTVRQIAYQVHAYFRQGHLEKVYENSLTHRLVKAGLDAKQQFPLKVWDEDGTIVGEYIADILIEGELIVEIKAAKSLAVEHEAQLLGYLRAAKMDHGLLINFGAARFQIRKFALSKPPKNTSLIV
jgi:GxxExxY protein